MSQDTGNALEGRFTAMHMTMQNMSAQMGYIATDTASIKTSGLIMSDTMKECRNISLQSMDYLANIDKNTKQLYGISETLLLIKKGTDKL